MKFSAPPRPARMGKIYCFSEYATAVVLSAADGQILSTIKMGEGDQTDNGLSHGTIAAAPGAASLSAPPDIFIALRRSSPLSRRDCWSIVADSRKATEEFDLGYV